MYMHVHIHMYMMHSMCMVYMHMIYMHNMCMIYMHMIYMHSTCMIYIYTYDIYVSYVFKAERFTVACSRVFLLNSSKWSLCLKTKINKQAKNPKEAVESN